MAPSAPRDVRVLLAADEPLHGRALKLLLEGSGFQALYVECLKRARRMLGGAHQEVLLWVGDQLDEESLEQARAIRETHPDVGVCVLANGADPVALRALLSHNARGFAFLLRGNQPEVEDLLDALARAAEGQATLEPCVLERMFTSSNSDRTGLEWLSRSEREVLELVAQGLRNREIARRLLRSEKTVEKRVGQLFSKLGLDPETNPHLDRRVSAARIFLSERHRRGNGTRT
jgi:DNA-binding NarL/FixJ family response regulator